MRWIAMFLASILMFASPSAAPAKDTLSAQIRAGKDVVIKSIRIIVPSTSVNQYGPSAQWFVVKIAFTNTTAYDFVPQLNKFTFASDDNTEFSAVTTGSPDLIGIENPHANDLLKSGATYEYTVAFLAPIQASGIIFYNTT